MIVTVKWFSPRSENRPNLHPPPLDSINTNLKSSFLRLYTLFSQTLGYL